MKNTMIIVINNDEGSLDNGQLALDRWHTIVSLNMRQYDV